MFGKRKSATDIEQELEAIRVSYHAEANRVQELVKENDRLRKTIGLVTRCPDHRNDNRKACERCGLVQHAMDTSKHEPCRRCQAGVEPGEFFLDISRSNIDKRMKGREIKVLTVCSSCHGVQPWTRKRCQRCQSSVETFRQSPITLAPDEVIVKNAFILKAKENEREVVDLRIQNADIKAIAQSQNIDSQKSRQYIFDDGVRRFEETHLAFEARLKIKDERIRGLERQLDERPVYQRDTDARVRAEARNLGVDTFMGFSIADHVEAMGVAEELARSVRKYGSFSYPNEIADRFLKLRTPPPVETKAATKERLTKEREGRAEQERCRNHIQEVTALRNGEIEVYERRIRELKSELEEARRPTETKRARIVCPECQRPATRCGGVYPTPRFFCPSIGCGWEGEV